MCGAETCSLVFLWAYDPGLWTSPVLLRSSSLPPFQGGMGCLQWDGVGHYPSPRPVKLWWNPSRLNSFSWRQALSRTESSGLFQNGYFSPFSARSTRELFSNIYCENLVELLEVKLAKVLAPPTSMTGSSSIFNSWTCQCWASSNLLIMALVLVEVSAQGFQFQ